jgi:antitoxin VapB
VALNIKDPETDRLARELAQATGESITEAAKIAIEERLARVRARKEAGKVRVDLDDLIERARAAIVLDDRSPDEIIGYDDDGLPR